MSENSLNKGHENKDHQMNKGFLSEEDISKIFLKAFFNLNKSWEQLSKTEKEKIQLDQFEKQYVDSSPEERKKMKDPRSLIEEEDKRKRFYGELTDDLRKKKFYEWYTSVHDRTRTTYGHHEKVACGDYYDCELLTDEWFRWFLSTPVSKHPFTNKGTVYMEGTYGEDGNLFFMSKRGARVYFTTASPYEEPRDVKYITMTEKASLLVPVYNTCASTLMSPSLDSKQKLVNSIISDLLGIKPNTVKATFDEIEFPGCCVIREDPVTITNIPDDNAIGIPAKRLRENNSTAEIYHSGFWLLIREDKLTPGDHELVFEAKSKNYQMKAILSIACLT